MSRVVGYMIGVAWGYTASSLMTAPFDLTQFTLAQHVSLLVGTLAVALSSLNVVFRLLDRIGGT